MCPELLRSAVRSVADQFGWATPARRARYLLQSRSRRRNWRDDDQLRHLIMLGLASDSNCIDIGANVGSILTWIAQAAPTGKHIAFEPVPALATDLRRRFPDIDIQEAAVSDTAGRASFTVILNQLSRSGLQPPRATAKTRAESIDVAVVRLDDALPEGYVPRLIKIDVEGSELETLRGAKNTIANNDVLVAFEHGHGLEPPDLARGLAVYDILADAGLRLFDMDGQELDRSAYEKIYVDGSRWNFLARK